MLTIDRRMGEAVYLNDNELKLTAVDQNARSVNFALDGNIVRLKHGQRVKHGVVEIVLLSIYDSNRVQFGFNGPRSVVILRGELYHKGNKLAYVDNATKQFPSGDFE